MSPEKSSEDFASLFEAEAKHAKAEPKAPPLRLGQAVSAEVVDEGVG